MLVIPENKVVIDTSYANFRTEANTHFNLKKHIYNYQRLTTNIYAFQGIPVNLSGISSINIEGSIVQVSISGEDCIIQINNNEPVVIEGLTDKSQLLLKPQLINNISYWTIVYNNEIMDKFPAEKMPNNYTNNMMFDVKDMNVDENNKMIFENV